MIDLNKLVSDSLTKMQSEGKIEALIEKHLSEALNSVINGLFSYSSDIRKELEKAFKEQIRVDLSQLTLPEYNKMILVMIQKMVDSHIHEQGLKKLEGDLKEMLSDSTPAEMKLSDLIREFAEELHYDDHDHSWNGEISFHHERGRISIETYHIYFDKESGKRNYSCAYNMYLSKGKISSCKMDGIKHDDLIIGKLYGFDRKLFQLYSAGTKIIPDFENVETSYCFDED